jgi:signal transduction histidine kinase
MYLLVKRIIFIACLMVMGAAYSQFKPQLLLAEEQLINEQFEAAAKTLKSVDTPVLNKANKAFYTYLKGRSYESTTKKHRAFSCYLTAKKLFKETDSLERAMDINLDIAYLIASQDKNTTDYSKYINEYIAYAVSTNNPEKLINGYSSLAGIKQKQNKPAESIKNYKKSIELLSKVNDKNLESAIYNNLASLYTEQLHKPDSGLYYLQKDLVVIKELGNSPNDLYFNYVNQASSYYHLKNYKKAIEIIHQADKLDIKDESVKYKEMLYSVIHHYYKSDGDYKKAYDYLLLDKKFVDSINVTAQNIAISDINTKYQTLEKELENHVLKGDIKTNRIFLYAVIGLLVASLLIVFLIFKNSRRKDKITQQEKLIEQQRFEKTLKDYELSSIDMMLEGQEKERQRIANDLHDNLGSMLATLKLNFENLKLHKNETSEDNKLYDKTDELIDEAYQKVRRLAHAKNAGVFANESLIPAIKKLANKISIPGKLQIEVIPFGFSDRLDNTLEFTIFRSIQELATNIIKHAKATEATIHLTNHVDNINIIIEDNGVGMDTGAAAFDDGMGLDNIRKKIEQLDGNFTIDSTKGRGTTIIIDLPL